MKRFSYYYSLAILIMAEFAFIACSNNDDEITTDEPQQSQSYTYTMAIEAAIGGESTTRALTYDYSRNKINAKWSTTDNVYVKKGSTWFSGSLQPDADNTATSTLIGTLSGMAINPSDELVLLFPRKQIDYTGQIGTLEDLAQKYDYAKATATVTSVNSGVITADPVTFVNQQAIVAFRLQDENGDDIFPDVVRIAAKGLKTSDTTEGDIVINSSGATNVIWTALSGINNTTVVITATKGSDTYSYQRDNVTFVDGKFYGFPVKMRKKPVYYLGFAAYEDPELTFSKNPNSVSTAANQGTVTVNSTCNFTYTTDGSCPITTEQYTTIGINFPSYAESRGWENEGKYIFMVFPQAFFQYDENLFYLLDPNTHKKYSVQAGNSPFEVSVDPALTYSITIDNVPHYVTRFSNNGVGLETSHFFDRGTY